MKLNDLSSAIFNWMVEKVIYLICALLLFLGAAFADVYAKEQGPSLPFWKKVISLLFACLLTGSLFGGIISRFTLDPFFMFALAGAMGVGAKSVAMWTLDLWQKSDGFGSMLGKIGQLVKSWNEIFSSNKEQKPPDTPAP